MVIKLSNEKVKSHLMRSTGLCSTGAVLVGAVISFPNSGLVATLITLALFALIFAIVAPLMTKKTMKKLNKEQEELYEMAEELSIKIGDVRKVICEGQGAYWMDSNRPVSSGWLVLSEDALEYYELKKYAKTGNVAILLDDIIGVAVQKKKRTLFDVLVVNTKDKTYRFNVVDGAIWKEQVDTTVAQ